MFCLNEPNDSCSEFDKIEKEYTQNKLTTAKSNIITAIENKMLVLHYVVFVCDTSTFYCSILFVYFLLILLLKVGLLLFQDHYFHPSNKFWPTPVAAYGSRIRRAFFLRNSVLY